MKKRMYKLFKPLLPVFILFLPGMAHSNGNLFLTGVEATTSSSSYFYLGTSLPLPESSLAKGYVLHLWADYLTYSYEAGATDIDAIVKSLSATIGYHDSGVNFWWNTRIGLIQSNTDLTPDDPGNSSAGVETGVKFQLEGEKRLDSDTKVNANLALVSKRTAYWLRARYMMRNDNDTYHGPEVIVQGDTNYEAFQAGWFLTQIPLGNNWDFTLKGGLRLDGGDVSEYAGIELSVPY